MTLDEALLAAIQHHQAGRLGEAEQLYRLILQHQPEHAEALHTETLVRLPGCFAAYRPPENSPQVAALPALAQGHITFGSFNAFLKISGEVLDVWGRLLLNVPGSRLLIKNKSFADAAVRESVQLRFSRLGIGPARLELLPRSESVRDHLSTYGRVDIALDTFPYCGTTTTCEALWMGVPVVTLAGQTHVSRVGLSLLTAAGLGELATTNAQAYVRAAAGLARDIDRLAELRRRMRDRLHASCLLDAPGLASNIESACRRMWHTWCAGSVMRARHASPLRNSDLTRPRVPAP